MKRIMSMMLMCSMVPLLLTGCGTSSSTETKSSSDSAVSGTISTESAESAEKVILEKLDEDITLYTHVKAGGNLDVRARALAPHLAKRLGVNVTVENVEGGGGVICATQFVTQRSHPHDIFMSAASVFTSGLLSGTPAYSLDDVIPVGTIDIEQFGLFVCTEQSGFDSMEDVIEYGKNNTIIFGSGGVGNVTCTMQQALYSTLGLSAETLTHSNAPEGLTNCMGGHNDITMAGLETARSYVESGDLIPVLTFSEQDFTGYDGITVPSITSLEGCEELTYGGMQLLSVGSDLPAEDVAFIQQALKDCLEDPECLEDLAAIGLTEPVKMETQEIIEYLNDEYDLLKKFS